LRLRGLSGNDGDGRDSRNETHARENLGEVGHLFLRFVLCDLF
jgi:hypothetical protein